MTPDPHTAPLLPLHYDNGVTFIAYVYMYTYTYRVTTHACMVVQKKKYP